MKKGNFWDNENGEVLSLVFITFVIVLISLFIIIFPPFK